MGGTTEQPTKNDSIRVLVVQGNPREASAVRRKLEAAPPNFVVSPARRLWSASQILAGISIDAILVDLDLPDSEGLATLTELRKQSPDVPVLVMGGADPASCAEAGADSCLGDESLDSNTLGMRIIEAIQRRKPARSAEEADASAETEAPPQGSVLVVEEDPWVRRLLERTLGRHDWEVATLSSPQKALAWVETNDTAIDLLLCDVHPPGMDPERLAAHLRKRFPKMSTLLVSAAKRPPQPVLDQPDQFTYLAKPYTLEELVGAVGELLSAARRSAE